MLEIYGAKVVHSEESIFTVFSNEPDELPHDFESYAEAEKFGEETYGSGNYFIESPC